MASLVRFRPSVRALMGLVLACGLAFGALSIVVESYRREWLGEQRAMAELRQSDNEIGSRAHEVGPRWLRFLAGSSRARYFYRIDSVFFLMPADARVAPLEPRNDRLVARHRSSLRYLTDRGWQWMFIPPPGPAKAFRPPPAEALPPPWLSDPLRRFMDRLREANPPDGPDDEAPPGAFRPAGRCDSDTGNRAPTIR